MTFMLFSQAFTFICTPVLGQLEKQPNLIKYSFYCQKELDPESGKKLPATVAWVAQRKKYIPVIYWKYDDFVDSGWDSQTRCEVVSSRMQTFYEKGILKYFSIGKLNRHPVICVISRKTEICNEENILLMLRRDTRADKIILQLLALTDHELLAEETWYETQTVGERFFDIEEILLNAPAINGVKEENN